MFSTEDLTIDELLIENIRLRGQLVVKNLKVEHTRQSLILVQDLLKGQESAVAASLRAICEEL